MEAQIAREKMVAGQLKPNHIHNPAVIARFEDVPRELFVDSSVRTLAYNDTLASMGAGRFMFEPKICARLIQALDVQLDDNVLVVASGTGYSATILAPMAGAVTAVEENPLFVDLAKKNASSLRYECTWVIGAPEKGCLKNAPYTKILCDCAVGEIPQALFDQLKHGGRLVAAVKDSDRILHAKRYSKYGRSVRAERLFECEGDVLVNFKAPSKFEF